MMDLNQFKEVNDALGHHHGDRLLVELGQRITAVVPEHATVARLGGDEFAVLLTDGSTDAEGKPTTIDARSVLEVANGSPAASRSR